MKYNIEFQIAGLMILILLSIDFFSKKHVVNKGTKVFPILLIVQNVEIILDIVKTIVVAERLRLPAWIPECIWKLYSYSVMTFAFFFSKYCVSMCEKNKQGKFEKIFNALSSLGIFAYIASIIAFLFVHPTYAKIEKGYIVTGVGIWISAMFSFSCVGLSLCYVFLSRKFVSMKHQLCAYLTWLLGCFFILFEYKFKILVMGFALSFIMLIIYFTLENPDIEMIEELDEAKKHADVANRAKTIFLATMSHEIRTPISIITGMNEMIIRESDDKQILTYSKNIHNASQSLLTMINDILDFSKIESGKMELEPKNYNVKSHLSSLIVPFEFKAKEKKLSFETIISEDLPTMLYGDENRLRQILSNILTNAVKYTNEGRITLKIDYAVEKNNADENSAIYDVPSGIENDGITSAKIRETNLEAQDTSENSKNSKGKNKDIAIIHVSVSDTGIGIKDEDKGRIFEAFQRIHYDKKQTVEGSGLGIPITVHLLKLMGSDLVVNSKYGEGSDFSYTIRQKIVDSTPIGKFKGGESEPVEKPKALMFSAPTARILAVDDSDMNLYILVVLLKRTNIQLETAKSGKECLEKASEKKYDIVFLDHMMPDMDGIETLQRLKEIELFTKNNTPVVALTANVILGAKKTYLDAGFTDYISKPIDSHRLEEVLLKYIPSDKVIRIQDE